MSQEKQELIGPRRLTLLVPPQRAGQRVDTLLRGELGLSGTVIRRVKWLPDGILLDGQRVNTSQRVAPGQHLSVRVADPAVKSGILPAPGPLDILYEDEDMLVLNKAPGVLVHPSGGHGADTMGNFLLHYYQQRNIQADFHPVHRLDKGTTGLMVVAKHPHAQGRLTQQLHSRAFRRVYLAVCQGAPPQEVGVVEGAIGLAEGSIVARTIRPDGLTARTGYRVLGRNGARTLVELELDTGRTHQIRVHMAHLGCPLVGDFLYGEEDPSLIPRPALHSAQLEVCQPITGEPLRFSLPLPEDMARLM